MERALDAKMLTGFINDWLDGLSEQDRMMFVRRYWFGDKSNELAAKMGLSNAGASRKLSRLRESLREYLTERGAEI